MKIILQVFTCLFTCLVMAQSPIEIGKSFTLDSKILNETREISVSVPESYVNNKLQLSTYPVVYVLDGETHFKFVSAAVEKFSGGNYPAIPEMIVVGITSKDRYKDFTPTHHQSNPTSGKSQQFTQFLMQEVIPFINQNYRTDSYKILIGHSLTGLYALDLVRTNPTYFNAYVAHDPSIWWNDSQFLKDISSIQTNLNSARVFLTQVDAMYNGGDLATHYNGIQEVKAYFEKVNPKNPIFKYTQYLSEDHGTVPLKGNLDALRWIFSGYELQIKDIPKQKELLQTHFEEFSKTRNHNFMPSETYLLKVIKYLNRVNAPESMAEVVKYYRKIYPNSPSLKTLY